MSFLSNGASKEKSDFIWSLAELLRGPYKKDHYGDVILPLCVIRRFDCVLESTKEAVLKKNEELKKSKIENKDPLLNKISGYNFNNTSKYNFQKLLADPDNIAANLRNYINGFSENVREIIENFDFDKEIVKLEKANRLYLIIEEFSKVDLHPDVVSNRQMGMIFEDLIRRFSENAEAGDHFTPREVIKLMVNLLLNEEKDELTQKGIITTVFDPACGTGGMLSVSENYILQLNPDAQVEVFGQEFNPQSYAICKSDMLIKGQDDSHIILGDSFTEDGHKGRTFRYMLANPPFGVEWKAQYSFIKEEHEREGFDGRFGAGYPRVSDGSLLFLQHMISKMNKDKGSRIAIVFNGSPLFSGDAGSGESEIRKWIIENDMLEGIIALPEQMFYNTGIFTYIWIVTNRKNEDLKKGLIRKGKVQLVNVVDFYEKMKKSQGDKRNYITDNQIAEITRIYGEFKEGKHCKIFDNKDFGYQKITVERPLQLNFRLSKERVDKLNEEKAFQNLANSKKKGKEREKEIREGKRIQQKILTLLSNHNPSKEMDLTKFIETNPSNGKLYTTLYKDRKEFLKDLKQLFEQNNINVRKSVFRAVWRSLSEHDETAKYCLDSEGNIEPDPDLRDYENVPLKEDINEYFEREVKPYIPDAWIDYSKTTISYEIPLTRHFYKFKPLRPSKEIMEDIKELEKKIQNNLERMMLD